MTINFSLLLPELVLVGVVVFRAILELIRPSLSHRYSPQLNLLGFSLMGAALILSFPHTGTTFGGMFVSDPFSFFFKGLFLLTAASITQMRQENPSSNQGTEFYLILLSALLGMFFLVSSRDFLLLFISLELLTLSLYILTAYTRSNLESIEAGLKYLFLGSLASAFLLYGISLLYASTGSLSFEEVGNRLREYGGEARGFPLLSIAGVLLILSALGFKVGAVPFQVWVPDVYQGAPTPVVAFLSVASKSAGFAALLRIFLEVLGPLENERRILFSVLSSLTLLYGNLGALVQKDMKRLLGYSSIGHAGFLLMALASNRDWGGVSLLYYLIAYAVSNLTAFFVVSLVEKDGSPQALESYRGLWRRAPFLAAAMFLAVLSLAGVPPLAGFFSKFFILLAAAKSGLFWIVFLGAVNVAISLYYYLTIVRILYLEKPKQITPIPVTPASQLVLYTLLAGILTVGIWQAPFLRLAALSAHSLF